MKKKCAMLLALFYVCFSAGAFAAVDAAKAQKLASKKMCLACHAVDKKLVGPAYKEVAKKYKGEKNATEMLAKKIIKGGSGGWGPIPMPPHPMPEADAMLLAEWVLSL